jgi:replicative DNA helicase
VYKWKFNLPDLQEKLGGIGPGIFGIIAARPDGGKTAFHLSCALNANGWVQQGAKVHVIANEEAPHRIIKRALTAFTGREVAELELSAEIAEEEFAQYADRYWVEEGGGYSMTSLEQYCQEHKPDILIIDQLDKVDMRGSFANHETKLRSIYISARELAKKYNCCVIGVSQASSKAHNKLHYGFECLDGSQTGKGAECDFCICIGSETSQGVDDYYRVANIPKNKLTGKKGYVPYRLIPELSRIVP